MWCVALPLLELQGVVASANGKRIIEDVSLSIERGRITVLLGPNGSGKSTILYTVMGIPRYRVEKGKIILDGEDITDLPLWERARRGIALAFQNPPRLPIKLRYLVKRISEMYTSKDLLEKYCRELNLKYLMDRDLFDGFSGGEAKRTELFITLLQKPSVALLDEPDSGVDIDSIKRIAQYINWLADNGSGVLLVTHLGYILQYLDDLDGAYVLYRGRIVYSGDAYDVLRKIHLYGYEKIAHGEV